jgi:pyruvate formate lyase activating enzyme
LLESLLKEKLLDCVAMDIKAPRERYGKASGADVDMKAIDRSISLIMKSGLDYEFRTTFVPGLHSKEDVRLIGEWLKGAKRYCIQNFRSGGTLDPGLVGKPSFTEKELQKMADIAKGYFESVEVRS